MSEAVTGADGGRGSHVTSPDDIDERFVPHPNDEVDEVAVAGGIVLRDGWRAAVALNDVGALIWSYFDGTSSLDAVSAEVSAVSGIDRSVVSAEVVAVARQLGAGGFLRGVGVDDGAEVDWRLVVVPDVEVGEQVDDSSFTDLDGQERTLAELRGGEAMLINWSPDCGYCWVMAERLAVLVEPLAANGVQLVLVASGTVEANRAAAEAAGIRCPIFIRHGSTDPFRAHGTPCSYHIDADGRLLAPIVHGTEAVLAAASDLAGVDPVTLLTDPESDPVPAGTRYLLGDDGTCAPGARGPVETWTGVRAYRLGDVHVGVRYDSEATGALLDDLFAGRQVRDRRAGYSFSVALPDAAEGRGPRGLNLLVAGGAAQVRSRYPSRVIRALLWRLQDEIHGFETQVGRVRVSAAAAVADGKAVLLPANIAIFGGGFQARLARAGVALGDVRFPEVDLETAELIVSEPRVEHDPTALTRLDRELASPTELAPVVPGRYPLLGWGVVHPGDHQLVDLAPWEAAAATLSLLWEAEDPPARLRDLGDLFTRTRGFGVWYDSEASLVEVISRAVVALDAGAAL